MSVSEDDIKKIIFSNARTYNDWQKKDVSNKDVSNNNVVPDIVLHNLEMLKSDLKKEGILVM